MRAAMNSGRGRSRSRMPCSVSQPKPPSGSSLPRPNASSFAAWSRRHSSVPGRATPSPLRLFAGGSSPDPRGIRRTGRRSCEDLAVGITDEFGQPVDGDPSELGWILVDDRDRRESASAIGKSPKPTTATSVRPRSAARGPMPSCTGWTPRTPRWVVWEAQQLTKSLATSSGDSLPRQIKFGSVASPFSRTASR